MAGQLLIAVRWILPSGVRRLLLTGAVLSACQMSTADDWMARLYDTTPIALVSIPGAHDAATGEGFTEEYAPYAEEFATTQALPLSSQWAAGVRAFDLRPAVDDRNGVAELHIYHGRMRTKASFGYAIRMLIDSLKAHPSEFAIVVMRHETDGDGGSERWAEAMRDFLNSEEIRSHIADYNPFLTVKDMRGRLLVLSRDRYDDMPVGGYIDRWTSEEDVEQQKGAVITGRREQGRLFVQDFYDTRGRGMKVKKANIRRMLSISAQTETAVGDIPMVINHTSGFAALGMLGGHEAATTDGYRLNAATTNRLMIRLLRGRKANTGLVMMDFAGVDVSGRRKVMGMQLIRDVINQNFKSVR